MAILILALGIVYADTDDSATGSFGLNAPPIVTNVNFVDSSYALTGSLTPDDSTIFGVNFTLQHSSTLAWIRNVTVYIFDDSIHGSDWASADPDGIQLTAITWTEAGDSWAIDQGAMTQWTMQSPVDPGSSYGGNTYGFVARFDISKVAEADSDWNCTVRVYDDDATPEMDEIAETGLVSMSNHFEISFSSATFTWGSAVQPGSVNNTHNALTLTILANAAWEIRINASNWTPGSIDIETNNTLSWDDDGNNGGISLWIRNTIQTALGTWDAQPAMTNETGYTRTCRFFLTADAGLFSTGITYETTVKAWIQADT